MYPYLDLLGRVRNKGCRQENRTGIDALVGRPAMMEFDLADGFPVSTTKKFAFKAMKGELIGFLQGKTNAADFEALGCNFWRQNADENAAWLANPNREGDGDMGAVYGAVWRDWHWREEADGYYFVDQHIDQVIAALDAIRNNPTDRGILVSAWKPDQFERMCLRPCHVLYQFTVDVKRRELSVVLYQRSGDLFLGVPVNTASAALMLSLFAGMTGLRPRYVTHMIAIPHLYVNHIPQADVQLMRTPMKLPQLIMNIPKLGMASDAEILDALTPDFAWLEGYESYGALPAPMAV